jgi:hypothetical protein
MTAPCCAGFTARSNAYKLASAAGTCTRRAWRLQMRAIPFGLILATLFAGQAAAQRKQDAQGSQDIVVVGAKQVPPKTAKRFVRQIASSIDGQLARFAEPVCPLVAGLSPEAAQAIEARLRDVAADAGAKIAKPGCRPNIVLMVAHDADAFVEALHKRFPGFFGALSTRNLRKALREGPVHSWSTIEIRDENGVRADSDDDGVQYVSGSASHITMPTQQVTVQSIVVLDDRAVMGKSVIQIADYVAMRTLAGARPPKEGSGADTILTLLDKNSTFTDPELTALDQGFLQGLYSARPDMNAIKQSGAIARRIVRNSKKD